VKAINVLVTKVCSSNCGRQALSKSPAQQYRSDKLSRTEDWVSGACKCCSYGVCYTLAPHWAPRLQPDHIFTPLHGLRYMATTAILQPTIWSLFDVFCTLSNQNNVCVPFCAKCATSLANFNQSDKWWRSSTHKFLVIQVSQLPQNSNFMDHATFPSILQAHSILVILFSYEQAPNKINTSRIVKKTPEQGN
jgi:hypothetical protein